MNFMCVSMYFNTYVNFVAFNMKLHKNTLTHAKTYKIK